MVDDETLRISGRTDVDGLEYEEREKDDEKTILYEIKVKKEKLDSLYEAMDKLYVDGIIENFSSENITEEIKKSGVD